MPYGPRPLGASKTSTISGVGRDASVDAGLAGEPQRAARVEHRRVEIGGRVVGGKREPPHLPRRRVHADDRVQPAVGDPWSAVRTDDHAVRRRIVPELHFVDPAVFGIEVAELARVLRGVPDRAVGRDGDIVRVRPGGTSYSCTAAGADVAGVFVVDVSRFAHLPSPSPDEHATASPSVTAAAPRKRFVMPGVSRTSSGPPGTPRTRRRRCSARRCR